MAICSKCRTGFNSEERSTCPVCGTYKSSRRRSGEPAGNGAWWSLGVPFLLGVVVALAMGSADFLLLGLLGSMLCCYLWSISWAYQDGEARGKSGCLVALMIAFISWPFGLIAWIIFRP